MRQDLVHDHEDSQCKISTETFKHYVDEAVQVAWGLITSIPPEIASCEPTDRYDEHLHDLLGDNENPPENGNYKLSYSRPILFTSCLKEVVEIGRVRIEQSEDATTKGDSVLKTASGSNCSGAEVIRKKVSTKGFV